MPFFCAPADLPATALAADLCIVGTGPAGATLARELSGSGLRILLLESGSEVRQAEADALNEVEQAGYPRVADQWLVRNRILGGTSHSWSGRCVPFDDIDFVRRPWVPHSGWPLPPRDLSPYFDRAAAYLGLDPGNGFSDARFWALAGRRCPLPAFDPALVLPHMWQFSRDTTAQRDYMRFGPRLKAQLGDNVTLVTNATLCDIDLAPSCDRVSGITLAGPDGSRRRIATGAVALCCGGIENARLLLNADSQVPGGIGNGRDLVGRYLMDHLRGPTATFALRGSAGLQRMFGHYRLRNGQVFAAGWRLSPALQEAEGLLNCSAWLEGRITDDDPWNALKGLARGRGGALAIGRVAAHAGLLLRGAHDYLVRRNGLPRKIDRLDLVCMVEQLPNPDSRVTLSARRDRLGLRQARIEWRVNREDIRTMARMTAILGAEFARLGLPPARADAWVAESEALPETFRDVAHPTGTTRMGHSPADSVVDPDCQVHGVAGLFVAGSSVFPTSSHANPTQMIVALALRLADRLRETARDGSTASGLAPDPVMARM
ncbi:MULTISPECIES: GMC oxidoreductase [unclassified Acidiphilium]|uniref:GMC oxidoreductase n=1 Tax=unclassified Acidiphilium TaxID=2617493 RepID=UPI000BCE2AC5|nr:MULTISPECIES: GMC family oxidoreductase [unclassified Acidiphilium]OYV57775.1 MAG: hypothetical protein B7Z76_00735 [Acidiphilium sp. 20-67-58]HQT60031.1 GMC family oxidoreductase [Acidiphilium sp.]